MALARQVSKLRKRFSRLGRKVRRNENAEDLHQLRIVTRRLRAAIWLSRHSCQAAGTGRVRKELRSFGHELGEKRTLDAAMEDARHFGLKSEKLSPAAAIARKKIRKLLRKKRRNRLETLLKDFEKKTADLDEHSLHPAVTELITRVEALKRVKPSTPRQWHLLRIEIKKIRYASELLCLSTDRLQSVQDLLGRLHDLDVLKQHFGTNRRAQSRMKSLRLRADREIRPTLDHAMKNLLDVA